MIKMAVSDYLRLFSFSNIKKLTKKGLISTAFVMVILIASDILMNGFDIKDSVLIFTVVCPLLLMIFSNVSNYCFLDKMIYFCPFSADERVKISLSKYWFKIVFEMLVASVFVLADLIMFKDIAPIGFIFVIVGDFSVSSCLWAMYNSSFDTNEMLKIPSYFAGGTAMIMSFMQLPVISGIDDKHVVFYISAIVYILLILPCTIFGIKGSVKLLKERAVSYIDFNEAAVNK